MNRKRGPALDLQGQILKRVQDQADNVWTPVDFLDLGPRAAVDKALQRLVHSRQLSRVDRGLYYQAHTSSLTGKPTVPGARAVVDAVARRDQSRIVVDGLTAANDLGFTTAVPARVVVLTDTRVRPIQLGNQQITFKLAAPSRLYWAGHPAMRIVQALYWLQDMMHSDRGPIIKHLRTTLGDRDHGAALRDDLRQGIHTLPIWMQSIVREVLGKIDNDSPADSDISRQTAKAHHNPAHR